MRITVSELKRIIKEEVKLAENPAAGNKVGGEAAATGPAAGELESKGGEAAFKKLETVSAFEQALKLLKTPKELATFLQLISKAASANSPALEKGERATLQSYAGAEKKRTSG